MQLLKGHNSLMYEPKFMKLGLMIENYMLYIFPYLKCIEILKSTEILTKRRKTSKNHAILKGSNSVVY